MSPLKASVRNGRLILDVPTNLPEGTELELVPADALDGLSEDERRRLHRALTEADAQRSAGQTVPAEEFLAQLRV